LWLGLFSGMLGDARGTLEHSQSMKVMAVKEPVWSGIADYFAGKASMIEGDWREGATYLHKAINFHESVGLFGLLHFLKFDQVELLAHEGFVDDALALVAEAINDHEFLHLRSPSLRQRADLLVQSSADISMIEEAYRDAVECARSQNARYYELQATTHLGRWLKSQGRTAEAQTLLGEVLGWFTEGLDTPALSDAKALLDDLTSKPSAPRRSNKSRRDASRPG
jgi:ATP/maltotriose-dependent transcriptional regulator MalT